MADRTLPWRADTRLVRLGDIEIDPRYRSVTRAGVAHELNPRCFELLLLFLSEPRVLHTRDEIFRRVWRGAVVEDSNLTTSIWLLRRALGGSGKQWIRTVSKQGYIFDPPADLELELVAGEESLVSATPAEAVTSEAPAVIDSAPLRPPVSAPSPYARGWMMLLAAAACLALVLLIAGLPNARSRENAAMRVVLAVAIDDSLPQAQRWPARLLQRWLGWQLRQAPQLELREPSDAAADGSETIVLIDLAAPAQDSEWRLSARFQGPVAQPPIVHKAAAKDLVAAIGALSSEVVARLTAIEGYRGPLLGLAEAAAQPLADAIEAEEQRRWGDAARAYGSVVTAAPDTGFARFHLARSLYRLGQYNAAQAELARAADWVEGLPEFLRAPLQAESLMIRENYAEAAAAFAALDRADPGRDVELRIAEARCLRMDGRSGEAGERLPGEIGSSPATAVAWLIERAEVDNANQNFRSAAANATRALELARAWGWEHDRARAIFVLTDAQANNGETLSVELLNEAEQGFAASGDHLGVLDARLRAELRRNQRAPVEMDQLLAEVNAAGNMRVKLTTLLRAGRTRFLAGDAREAHEWVTQAAAVANASGNLFDRRRVNSWLLQLDMLRLDLAGMDRHLKLLDAEPPQGTTIVAIGLNRARLQYWRGEFDAAQRTLDDAESRLRSANPGSLPQDTAVLDCLRASVFVVQGRTADARTAHRNCRSHMTGAHAQLAEIGEAELAVQTGDLAEARRLLASLKAKQGTQDQPNHWALTMEAVPVFARLGEISLAKKLIEQTLPLVQQAGYRITETNLRITRAEIALAENRPDQALREIEQVEKLSPPDYWIDRRRIRTVQALVLQMQGKADLAAQALDALHADVRTHGDVLGELLVHSLMDLNPSTTRCPDEDRLSLLSSSGMRGASDLWMYPAGRDRAPVASVMVRRDAVTP